MSTMCSRCHIVLAEDNPADVGLVRRALREHDVRCELHVISDGKEVLSFIEGLDLDSNLPCPDLVLLDLYLPKHDGKEVLKHLRASKRCAETQVVVLTSSDSPSARETAEKNAAVHFFRKSSSLTEFMQLGRIVKEVLDHGPSY